MRLTMNVFSNPNTLNEMQSSKTLTILVRDL